MKKRVAVGLRLALCAFVALACLGLVIPVTACADESAQAPEEQATAEERTEDAPEAIPADEQGCFPDIPASHWANEVVGRAVELGLISGYSDGTFGPSDNVTRGQVAVMLWHMSGNPKAGANVHEFPDVNAGSFYYEAVRWITSMGIARGYDSGKFGPDDNVTREQLATMIANYAKNVRGKVIRGESRSYLSKEDAAEVSDYAVAAVGWCFKNRILSGAGTTVGPKGFATRAQTAKMMVRLYDMVSMGKKELRKASLKAYQKYLTDLSKAESISLPIDSNELPRAGEGDPALLYAFAIGDVDADGQAELVFCIRDATSAHLSSLHVAKYSPSAVDVIKDAPVSYCVDTFENLVFHKSGWAELDGANGFAPLRDGIAGKYDVKEGCRLCLYADNRGRSYSYEVQAPKGVELMRRLTESEYNALLEDVASEPLEMTLQQATEANISGII